MKVLLCNAYSANNSGDGLLVRLTKELINEAIEGPHSYYLSTSDPGSFPCHASAFEPFRGKWRPAKAAAGLLAMLVPFALSRRVLLTPPFERALRESDLIVSVGGGYLRGDSIVATVKSMSVHLSQMALAGSSEKPWVVAPQSIGPYAPMAWPIVKRVLRRARCVMVRDQISYQDLREIPGLLRIPDLAVLVLPEHAGEARRPKMQIAGLVIRDLRRPGHYLKRIGELLERSIIWVPLLQSTHSGNDDRRMLSRLGLQSGGRLADVLKADENCLGAVVSVRLHGALESIHAGVPAVHLSYERKGFAAYSDMGLEKYVHSARDFNSLLVARQVEELLIDPSRYWAAMRPHRDRILETRHEALRTVAMAVQP